jgi:hypothetical protein
MYVSEQKKQENIAEYILYMWQIEDVIRACKFKLSTIGEVVVSPELPENEREKHLSWYQDLIDKMKVQGIEQTGHLFEVNEVMIELAYLHNALLDMFKDEKYIEFYSFAEQYMNDFKKVNNNPQATAIEICLSALYGKLILKLQKREISAETEEAFEAFRNVLAYLSVKYNQMKEGKLV